MKKQNEGIIERLCNYLGRQNFTSDFLDFFANLIFPSSNFAYSGVEALSASKAYGNGVINDLTKPIIMAKPPKGAENFSGNAPITPSEAHTQPTEDISPWRLYLIPLIGGLLHKYAKEERKHAKAACSDPLYRGMHGAPCKFEGGSDSMCPTGTISGWYWSYEVPTKGRVYYVDCCGGTPSHTVFCNWTSEQNWCAGYGKANLIPNYQYNCTLSILEADLNIVDNGKGYFIIEGVDDI